MDTKTVNLRNVPADLVRRAKAFAALQGLSLKGFILKAVEQVLEESELQASGVSLFASTRFDRKKPQRRRKRKKQRD